MALSMVPCPGGTGTAYTTTQCIYDDTTGTYEQIISSGGGGAYGGGTFCTKSEAAAANMPGTAWAERCYTRNAQGELYSIYGSGAMPYTVAGNPAQQGQTPLSSADPQYWTYMNQSRPGSLSRFMQKNRVMPWYTNTFGTRKSQMTMQEYDDVTDEETEEPEEGLVGWLKSVFGAEEDEIEDIQQNITGMQTTPTRKSNWAQLAMGIGLVGIVGLYATNRIG